MNGNADTIHSFHITQLNICTVDEQCVIVLRLMWTCVSALLLILRIQLMYDPEGLEELIEVNAAILVEIDAACHVVNGSFVHIYTQVRTEQGPCLAEFLTGNLTCRMWGSKPMNSILKIPPLNVTNDVYRYCLYMDCGKEKGKKIQFKLKEIISATSC